MFEVGTIITTVEGCQLEVVDFFGCNEVHIKFLDDFGYTKITTTAHLKTGRIKNPYYPSVYTVGYLGVGLYQPHNKSKANIHYVTWKNMLTRCYGEAESNATYNDCIVCDDWLCFQTFAAWFDTRTTLFNERGITPHLDKDLLAPLARGKLYSPKTCVIVNVQINIALHEKHLDNYLPAGVSWNVAQQKFQVKLNMFGKQYCLGKFDCPIEASKLYFVEKSKYMKILAQNYRHILCEEAYNGLINWK